MQTVTTLADRYRDVQQRVHDAAHRSGRAPNQVMTVAVSKYAELDEIRELIHLGHQDFGESRVQQLVQRAAVVDELLARHKTMREVTAARHADKPIPQEIKPLPDDVRWHMIGHLQRNKAKKCATVARLVHTVDSLRLIEELHAIAIKKDLDIDVLVQVNIADEPNKHGCAIPAARHLCEQIDHMAHLHVRGLMTMAPFHENPEHSRSTFERCRDLFFDIAKLELGDGRFNLLSMGMSNDYEVAIEAGANIVRIGSAIFGTTQQDHDPDPPHPDD